jgi:hypothetical protein
MKHWTPCVIICILAALLPARAFAADYYLSATGDDAHSGTTPGSAWRTIARANRQSLRPGDQLLLRGGDTFQGNLVLNVDRSLDPVSPITIASHGQGRATIRAGEGIGILAENMSHLVIRDLEVEGADRRTNHGAGISVVNRLPGAKQLHSIRVENVEARGFGEFGIAIGGAPADNSQSGFRGIRIVDCRATDNAMGGIHVFGCYELAANRYAHRDVAIIHCTADANPGNPKLQDQHSGNGILIHDVDGGLIDACTATGNGGLCHSQGGGPVGIWAWSSRKLIIQNCVSVRNRTGCAHDGGGFDLDGGVSESIMQYNYSAENDGAGFLAYDFGAAPFSLADNVIRFNISENDGRKHGYASICADSEGAPIERLQIYHNTVFMGPAGKDRPEAIFLRKAKDCRVCNNLFITTAGCPLAHLDGAQPGLRFQGNHYWAVDDQTVFSNSGKELTSLAHWRQCGFEKLGMKELGATGIPGINAWGGSDIVLSADKRLTLARYQPVENSRLLKAGIDLKALFKIDIGDRDFGGARLPDHFSTIGARR